jgi:2-polyprenyl-3-methyl-5-hydroxy-6-metoxy-1,4-benzoquinol methylase
MGGGGILEKIFPGQLISFLAKNKFLSKNDKILDVGCGVGRLLFSLKENGFDKLLGIDPFLEDNIYYPNGLSILKKTIHELEDSGFNLIMLNHSFEHMSDPLETLESAEKLLGPDGILLIRIPTVSSFAWNHYKENWLLSGAPEHFYLHSEESIRYLAEKSNLRLERTIYDSSTHQLMNQYELEYKNIFPCDKKTYNASILNYLLNLPQIIRCQKMAEDLNAKNQGETCAFVLTKK